MDGNKEYGSAWFKVSEFNVWVDTLDANGDWKWNFAPTDNITFEVNAQHFNGTDVANGAIVSVDAVMIMKEGPPIKVPADIYEVGSSTTSNGVSTVSVKPKSGKKFVQGQHMAIIKVNDTSTGKIEIQEAWFDIRVMDVWGYAQQWIVSDGENVSIVISAKNLDGTPIENATVSLKELRDTMSWTPVELPSYAPVNTSNTGSAIFQFSAENLSDGEYEARLTVTSAALGASSEVFVWFRVSTYQISGWYADQSKWTYSPGESVALWVEVRYPNGTGAQGANVSIYQLANTENWPWKYVNASSSVATTDSQGRAKITFIAPSTSGFYNPMLNINGDLSKTPWELPGIQVKSASVSVDIYDNGTGYHEDVFGLDDVIRVDVGLSSTSNINGIKFYITELGDMPTSDDMVGSVSSDDIDTTTSYMITPSVAGLSAGEYILHTKVNVTTSDGYADVWEKRWLRIEELSFDVNWWTDTWSYTPGSDVVINMTSYPSENFNVSIVELRNVHAWSAVNISGVAVQNIAGSGTFEFTAPNETGEYQAELCIYTSGSCTEDSMRLWVWFSVETFHVWGWPDQPSYMSDDNVRLNILAIDPSTKMAIDPASYDVSFIELRDAMSWVDKSSLINSSAIVNDTDTFWEGLGTTLTFDAPSESGEYMFRAQLTKGSDIRYIDVWFKVSSFRVILDTVPPTKWTGDNKFGEDENITFNITVQPVVEGNATLGIRDDYNWETVKEYVVELVNGTAIVNASVSKTGYYMAIATVGTAEDQYWFQATAFSVKIKHDDSSTTHEVKMVDNVTIVFNVSDNDGSEYTGDINVTVKNIRNGWDWSIVASNVFDTTVTAVLGVEQFNFSHGLEVGDYELELEFEKDGKIVQDWFWFRVKDKEFWAWPDQPSYMPGENVTINVYIGNPDAILGINVSLETVRYSNTWEDVTDEIVSAQMWNLTDASGKAQITFTTSPNRTGWFDVELIEDGSGVRSGMGYQVNSLDVNFERDEDKWMFAPVDNFTGILYVYGGDGSPAANRSVEVMLKSHDWTDVGVVNNGTTDASGQFAVNFSLAYPSNEYVALIKVDNGASEIHEWFSIQSMKLDWWAVGESSGRSDEIETTDNVIVTVEVRDMAGQPISGANVSLGDSEGADVRNLNGWAPVDITGDEITSFAVTDSYGRAELKFLARNLSTGE
ncbi:MAG: hypothetical protein KAS11_01790, partial [Candidatus Aenigmarchaeota archaeon]|nr:hypothetical protein [Candidatus Aenigmarchaeota archaeon]